MSRGKSIYWIRENIHDVGRHFWKPKTDKSDVLSTVGQSNTLDIRLDSFIIYIYKFPKLTWVPSDGKKWFKFSVDTNCSMYKVKKFTDFTLVSFYCTKQIVKCIRKRENRKKQKERRKKVVSFICRGLKKLFSPFRTFLETKLHKNVSKCQNIVTRS